MRAAGVNPVGTETKLLSRLLRHYFYCQRRGQDQGSECCKSAIPLFSCVRWS